MLEKKMANPKITTQFANYEKKIQLKLKNESEGVITNIAGMFTNLQEITKILTKQAE